VCDVQSSEDGGDGGAQGEDEQRRGGELQVGLEKVVY